MRFYLHSLRRPRHPLMRFLSLLLGLAVIGVLLVFGLVVAGVLLVGGGLWLAWRQWKLARAPRATAAASPSATNVLEGEFVVIREGRPAAR